MVVFRGMTHQLRLGSLPPLPGTVVLLSLVRLSCRHIPDHFVLFHFVSETASL